MHSCVNKDMPFFHLSAFDESCRLVVMFTAKFHYAALRNSENKYRGLTCLLTKCSDRTPQSETALSWLTGSKKKYIYS